MKSNWIQVAISLVTLVGAVTFLGLSLFTDLNDSVFLCLSLLCSAVCNFANAYFVRKNKR